MAAPAPAAGAGGPGRIVARGSGRRAMMRLLRAFGFGGGADPNIGAEPVSVDVVSKDIDAAQLNIDDGSPSIGPTPVLDGYIRCDPYTPSRFIWNTPRPAETSSARH